MNFLQVRAWTLKIATIHIMGNISKFVHLKIYHILLPKKGRWKGIINIKQQNFFINTIQQNDFGFEVQSEKITPAREDGSIVTLGNNHFASAC